MTETEKQSLKNLLEWAESRIRTEQSLFNSEGGSKNNIAHMLCFIEFIARIKQELGQ